MSMPKRVVSTGKETDFLEDLPDTADNDEDVPKLSHRESNQQLLNLRRKIEDRLERKRLRDELGCDDLGELDV